EPQIATIEHLIQRHSRRYQANSRADHHQPGAAMVAEYQYQCGKQRYSQTDQCPVHSGCGSWRSGGAEILPLIRRRAKAVALAATTKPVTTSACNTGSTEPLRMAREVIIIN